MKLSELFTKKVITAQPDEQLGSVAQKMREHNVGAVVVVEQERPVGIITDRDVAMSLGAKRLPLDAPVEVVMTRHVVAIPEDTGIFTATRFIQDAGVRRLPVVDREDRVVGIVSLDDILRCLAREFYNLVQGMEHEMKVR